MKQQKIRTLEKKAYVKNGAMRIFFTVVAIIIEIVWLYTLATYLSMDSPWINTLVSTGALLIAVIVYGRWENASMKMLWMLLMIAFPPLGILLYLLTGLTGTTKAMRSRFHEIEDRLKPYLTDAYIVDPHLIDSLPPQSAGVARYLTEKTGLPLYADTSVVFHRETSEALESLKRDLSSAKHFIFMEYYAIEDSAVFEQLYDILRRKVDEGVEVRIFYDDIGSVFFINRDFARRMEAEGIHCRVFNPMMPIANILMNHRDHRKITVIDGQIGYTGGYNIADEYFHLQSPYGYWKDTGVRLEGPAVRSLTVLFLTMWESVRRRTDDSWDDSFFFPAPVRHRSDALVQPYGDSPLIQRHVGEDVYMSLLGCATTRCWFTTPYLILSDEMTRAFSLAAERGVDVRIVTPGIPDKKLTFRITRSSYRRLAAAGVRIYEYTPGFCHAKQCLCDDSLAVCGTINLDYRSLYHHFEDAVMIYGGRAISYIRADFEALFPQCREVTEDYSPKPRAAVHFAETILRLIAPLL